MESLSRKPVADHLISSNMGKQKLTDCLSLQDLDGRYYYIVYLHKNR